MRVTFLKRSGSICLTLDVLHPLEGALDAAVDVAAPGIVAGVVEDLDLFGSGRQALLHHRPHHLGMGVGGQFRGAVPAHVRLDHHHIPRLDEALHAAQGVDGLAGDGRIVGPFSDGDQGLVFRCQCVPDQCGSQKGCGSGGFQKSSPVHRDLHELKWDFRCRIIVYATTGIFQADKSPAGRLLHEDGGRRSKYPDDIAATQP